MISSPIPFYFHRLAAGQGPGRDRNRRAKFILGAEVWQQLWPGWRRCSAAASLGNEISPRWRSCPLEFPRSAALLARRDLERPTRARCAARGDARDPEPAPLPKPLFSYLHLRFLKRCILLKGGRQVPQRTFLYYHVCPWDQTRWSGKVVVLLKPSFLFSQC